MTRKRNDECSTEYGLWTREQPEIDSSLGFVATNIDWLWQNYKSGLWMLKEEKRYRYLPEWWQVELYRLADSCARIDDSYRGFHVLVFEETNPDDGYAWLDGNYNISRQDLIEFLRFEKSGDWYKSYFPPKGLRRLARKNKKKSSRTSVLHLKRLQKIENDLWELINDVGGDVQKNVKKAHRLIADAVEIEREN